MTDHLVDPHKIQINREARQRREVSIEDLVPSIAQFGLINPIVVTEDLTLIAGERRLMACLHLGLPTVPVRYFADLPPEDIYAIELEENIKRKDLTWQETVTSIAHYHEMRREIDPEWLPAKTGETLGFTRQHIMNFLNVHALMDHELVQQADKLSTAVNAAARIRERRASESAREATSIIDDMLTKPTAEPEPGEAPGPEPKKKEAPAFILNENFLTWTETYDGPPFNFIHCDFPYGVNIGDKVRGQAASKSTGYYEDTPDVYWALVRHLCGDASHIIAPSAHLIFWFSMKFYAETLSVLTEGGWNVDSFPLIWHKSDNAGIIPDANRGPRRTYETALFASRGDRKVVRAVSNSVSAATTKDIHTSEKPRAVLDHFFRMVVDDTTRLLDPTAGGGNAIRVGYERGAKLSLGLELDAEYAASARENVRAGIDKV